MIDLFTAFATTTSALECELFDLKCQTSDENSTCSSLQRCDNTFGVTPACYARFEQNSKGGMRVLMKGCAQESGHDCKSSPVCSGLQARSSHEVIPTQYYCCCTQDRCNHQALFFVTEEKEQKGGKILHNFISHLK